MAHTGWCTSSASREVVGKIKAAIAKNFGGSADPEVYDCPHVIDVIHEKFDDEAFSAQAGGAFYCHKAALPGMGSTSCAACGASRASDGASCGWLAPHLAFWPHR